MLPLPNFYLGYLEFLAVTPDRLYPVIANEDNLYKATQANYTGSAITWIGKAGFSSLSLLINTEGQLYFWGTAGSQLGNEFAHELFSEPYQLNTNGIAINAVVMGYNHALFLSAEGDLYGSGANYNSQLGFTENILYDFSSLGFSSKVKYIAAVGNTSYVVTESGALYGCGENQYGQLGMSHKNRVIELTKVPFDIPIKKVVPSDSAAYFLTEQGHVYSCGLNVNEGLGYATIEPQTTLKRVPLPEYLSIEDLLVFGDTVIALSAAGHLYGWGSGKSGILSNEHLSQTTVSPQRIYLDGEPFIAMYGTRSYGGALLVNKKFEVVALGGSFSNKGIQSAMEELSKLHVANHYMEHHNKAGVNSASRKALMNVGFFFTAPSNNLDVQAQTSGQKTASWNA